MTPGREAPGTLARVREELAATRALPRTLLVDFARRALVVWLGVRAAFLLVGSFPAPGPPSPGFAGLAAPVVPVAIGLAGLAAALVALDVSVTRERLLLANLGISRGSVVLVALAVAALLEAGARGLVAVATAGVGGGG